MKITKHLLIEHIEFIINNFTPTHFIEDIELSVSNNLYKSKFEKNFFSSLCPYNYQNNIKNITDFSISLSFTHKFLKEKISQSIHFSITTTCHNPQDPHIYILLPLFI